MFYLFHGPDIVSSREALVRLKVKYSDSEVIVAAGEGVNLVELRNLFESRPMFHDRRLIVVETAFKDFKKSELFVNLTKLPDFIDVVFWQGTEIKKTDGLYQLIMERKGIISTFKETVSKEVFPLLDAVIAKNKNRALYELNRLLLEDKEPLYILKMITWQMRNLLSVKVGSAAVRKLHPFALKKIRASGSHFRYEEIEPVYRALLKTDVLLKTTELDPDMLLLRLVLAITGGNWKLETRG